MRFYGAAAGPYGGPALGGSFTGGGGSVPSYDDLVLADGPVGYWPLYETAGAAAEDLVGANDGTYVNTPTLNVATLVADDPGGSVQVVAANSEEITLPAIRLDAIGSVEFWFKWTAGSVLFRDHSQLSNVGWLALDSTGTFQVRVRAVQINTSKTTAQVRDGNIHHFVLAKSGANVEVYLDGASIGTSAAATDVLTDVPWHFGRNGLNVGQYSDAVFQKIALYDIRLSGADISAHYAAGT